MNSGPPKKSTKLRSEKRKGWAHNPWTLKETTGGSRKLKDHGAHARPYFPRHNETNKSEKSFEMVGGHTSLVEVSATGQCLHAARQRNLKTHVTAADTYSIHMRTPGFTRALNPKLTNLEPTTSILNFDILSP